MRNPAHIGLKQEENDSPSRSPSEQQRSTSTDTPVQHRFMTPSTYHINGDRIEYVDMQGNHFATTHSAPLPLHQLLPPKPAKYEPFAQPGAIEPPFRGYCENTHDALILFEAAKRGIIPRVTRRLTDREKAAMIKSGAVFVFDEHESNIKRWTDGMSWSPSRIYGNYLVSTSDAVLLSPRLIFLDRHTEKSSTKPKPLLQQTWPESHQPTLRAFHKTPNPIRAILCLEPHGTGHISLRRASVDLKR
jgi:hypothetical protein